MPVATGSPTRSQRGTAADGTGALRRPDASPLAVLNMAIVAKDAQASAMVPD
jgi:hypothetical protein